MSSFYENILPDIQSIILEYGRTFILREYVKSGSKFDPDFTPVDNEVKGVTDSYSTYELKTLIAKDKGFIYLLPDIVADTSMKLLEIGSNEEFEIISVEPIKPGDTLLFANFGD